MFLTTGNTIVLKSDFVKRKSVFAYFKIFSPRKAMPLIIRGEVDQEFCVSEGEGIMV